MTEEASPLVGGLMAHDGHLKLAAVGAWITAGTWLADILLYYLGRSYYAASQFTKAVDTLERYVRSQTVLGRDVLPGRM